MERLDVNDPELTVRMDECYAAVPRGGVLLKIQVQQNGVGDLDSNPAFAARCRGDILGARRMLATDYLTMPVPRYLAGHVAFMKRTRAWTNQGIDVIRMVYVDEETVAMNWQYLSYINEGFTRLNGPWGGERTYWTPSSAWRRAGIRPPRRDWCLYGTLWATVGYDERGAIRWRGFLHADRDEEDAQMASELEGLRAALAPLQDDAWLLDHGEPPGDWPYDDSPHS